MTDAITTKRDDLLEEKKKHLAEIEDIEKRIDSQSPDAQVNDMYARINKLEACIQKIDVELFNLESPSGTLDNDQAQKAIDIISGGGGVDIRPKAKEVVDPGNEQGRKPVSIGPRYAACVPVKP